VYLSLTVPPDNSQIQSMLIGCSYSSATKEMACYNIVSSGVGNHLPSGCDVLSAQLAVPTRAGHTAARSHCAINLLGMCFDLLAVTHSVSLPAAVCSYL